MKYIKIYLIFFLALLIIDTFKAVIIGRPIYIADVIIETIVVGTASILYIKWERNEI